MKIPAEKLKSDILESLKSFDTTPLKISATRLFGTLGYRSDRTLDLSPNTPKNFLQTFDAHGRFRQDKGLLLKWASADILFQVTDEEINALSGGQLRITFESDKKIEDTVIQSYLFTAVELKKDHYTRTELAKITREINRLFPMPVLILFKNGETLTFSIINRRLHKKDTWKDVLEKVTLIKDIRYASPHRAHIEILYDLTSSVLFEHHHIKDFVSLHQAWQKTLDTNELNRRFYREMANWYFWALHNVTFPSKNDIPEDIRNPVNVIRLITRIIFVWFVKEKGLITEALFNKQRVNSLLDDFSPESSSYYKAVLQNLFFATLNTKMGERKFRDERRYQGKSNDYMIHNRYRSRSHFNDPESIVELTKDIPFLNGGLFECLDRETEPVTRIDGFSDRDDNELSVPNYLFFSDGRAVDLNADYGTKNRKYKVRGLIDLLQSYKFTITENTPIEEEIALDPELLGKVFENLLASYNPETKTTARKLTGSFYTPREIVNYMVDEALIAYLENTLVRNFETDVELSPRTPLSQGKMFGKPDPVQTKLSPTRKRISAKIRKEIQGKLRHLFEYNEEDHKFTDDELEILIEAIDNAKILDPACGSGAFPMGILHRLVYLLGRLDPGNKRWKDKQIAKASEIQVQEIREEAIENIEYAFERNELDYPRKLYLIQNCIFGVDIQPVAVQIAKLRFFISLIVDQKIDNEVGNRGIRPLPNLETKIVAANALIGLKGQMKLRGYEINSLENELKQVRRDYFEATSRKKKRRCEERDKEIREKMAQILETQNLFKDTSINLISWDPYNQNQAADFFDPEWMFGETQGFDLVIGNPPYVRADSGEQHLALRKSIEDSKLYETLWEKWDLYIPFIERGYRLLRPYGFTTMIVSDAFCHSKYAQKSQEWFLKNSRVHRLDFFSKIKIFDAGVHNITYLFQKSDGSDNKPERRVHGPEFGTIKMLPTAEQSTLNYRAFFPEDTSTQRFSVPALALDEICYVTKGMVVHADEKVAQGLFKLKNLISDKKDKLHPKPFAEGKNIERWLPAKHNWLEWGTERAPILFSRRTFVELYEQEEKLMLVKVGAIRAALDKNRLYCNEGVYVCIPWHGLQSVRNNSLKKAARYLDEAPARLGLPCREDLEKTSRRFNIKYLLAILNSSPACNFLRTNRRNNIQLYPDDWKKVFVPDTSPEQQAPIVRLVDEILVALRADPAANITSAEAEIDARVAQLYGLTEEEYSLILSETDTPDHFRVAALNLYRDME